MVVVALDLVESVDLVSVDVVVNCIVLNQSKIHSAYLCPV